MDYFDKELKAFDFSFGVFCVSVSIMFIVIIAAVLDIAGSV